MEESLMIRTAVFPGSFNPWHEGHWDILIKALKVFDEVIVARLENPSKKKNKHKVEFPKELLQFKNVRCCNVSGLLVDFIKDVKATAVIRGLRNSQDFEFEKSQQYWNEDFGLEVPVVLFICDRLNTHVSSSILRSVDTLFI